MLCCLCNYLVNAKVLPQAHSPFILKELSSCVKVWYWSQWHHSLSLWWLRQKISHPPHPLSFAWQQEATRPPSDFLLFIILGNFPWILLDTFVLVLPYMAGWAKYNVNKWDITGAQVFSFLMRHYEMVLMTVITSPVITEGGLWHP